ncbi:hypothetical protein [Nonomuraea basaltis]|uniref:hypothetical protein n=1 Tax=Nonomuraea basaltis TaxID=2495887 RepID=UPI00110C7037|nr:hypothetical protein [Nonomuraea basaltis]TMR97711.1 hypothetical protein EJK15_16875 [Nonomuraea basaltis]
MATVNSGAPTASASAAAGSDQASELKFSQCMRDQGLTWFPDPGPDGGMKVSVPPGTDQSKYEKAEEACKAYAPGANQNGTISDEDLNKLRQMAQCIRDHGFSKYPDPDANGGTHFDPKTVGVEPDDPAFEKARQECQKYLPPRKSGGNS